MPASTNVNVASTSAEVQSNNKTVIIGRPRPPVIIPHLPESRSNEPDLEIEYVTADQIHPADDQFMDHPPEQEAALCASIVENGPLPIFTDLAGNIIDGHANFAAQQKLGYDRFAIIRLRVDVDQAAHLRIGLNKIPRMSTFDPVRFRAYVKKILPITIRRAYQPEMVGMSSVEHDEHISSPDEGGASEEINAPETQGASTTQLGDTWFANEHVIHCGDSRDEASYVEIMGDEKARLCVTDPPFNVPIAGHVSGLGKIKHHEFVQASGEMTAEQFATFLKAILERQKEVLVDGGLSYNFMDWRSIDVLINQGRCVFDEYKQLIVWNKTSGGMGSFYRSKHELIAVFKNGTASHVNNFGLGAMGRYRTNVFDYAGANVFSKSRDEDLAAHPTVKPTIMIADIIKDVSRLGDVVLDPFGGSGTTMLAATMGSFNFEAQYQQNPVPRDGQIIKRSWLRYYETIPEEFDFTLISWDTASTTSETADFSVGTVWGRCGRDFYLLDVVRERYEPATLWRKIEQIDLACNADATIIEDTELGRAIVSEMRRSSSIRPILSPNRGIDKRSRIEAQAPKFEAGQVLLPQHAPWLAGFVGEVLGFPSVRHDDQVDSVSQALRYFSRRMERVPRAAKLDGGRARVRPKGKVGVRNVSVR